ncbi:MAG: RNA methyltransferase [candidate division Zixibacteria bacterium]|nr:RNA methyltransferase [candidate division Zixibacteria bacterium]
MALTNTELKSLKALRSRRGPLAERRFLAEGVRVLEDAFRFRVRPAAVYVAATRLSDRGQTLVGQLEQSGATVREIPARQLDAIADTETSQGIVAVFERPGVTLKQPGRVLPRTLLVCDGISDPGNMGTLFRSALAFGFGCVVVCGDGADPFAPKVVRGSAGAIFGLAVISAEAKAVTAWLSANGYVLIAADQKGAGFARALSDLKGKDRLALAVGSEGQGLSATLVKACHSRVRVEHEPVVESLNAAVAGSILMKGLYDLCHSPNS